MGTDPISTTIAGGVGALTGANAIGGAFSQPSMPNAPDYKGAAEATAEGNLKAAQAAAAANRVSQHTTYGNLDYTQTGTDSSGNPMWTATQTLSPEQQQIYNQQTGLSQGMLGAAQKGMGALNESMANPTIDLSQLPSYGIDPGQSYSDAMMQQMNPQLERQQSQLNTQLANQGIPIGSEAYKSAQQDQSDAANRARLQAITGGMGVGLQANQQAFGQQLQNKQLPVNLINALRGGSQVQGPNYINAPQQATTPGVDFTGAAQQQGQFDMNQYNQQMASKNAMTSGLMGLGGAGLMAMSDRRVKENIHQVGRMTNGLNVYEFDYKQAFKDIAGYGRFIGVMADEVEKIIPEAVFIHPTGYKMVNYSMIGG
jgi:hypothetical protein